MKLWLPNSLQGLLRAHQASMLLLVLVTAGLAATWAFFWQESSQASLRLNGLLVEAQAVRGDVYRQLKEISKLSEPQGREQYWQRLYRIDEHFFLMDRYAETKAEKQAVAAMEDAYELIGATIARLMLTTNLEDVQVVELLNPAYERWMTGDFEAAYDRLTHLVAERRDELQARIDLWLNLAPWLSALPLVIAGLVVWRVNKRFKGEFVRPMESLAAATTEFAQDALAPRVPEQGVAEVRQLARTLNVMGRQLEANRRELIERERQAALGALVPVIAHNIRNPLAGIRANAQLLDAEASRREITETGADIVDAADRLERWLTALLAYLHPLSLHLMPADLAAVAGGAIAALGGRPAALAVRVEQRGVPAPVNADAPLLEQALHGLLSNALEASPRAGTVTVSTGAGGGHAQLVIVDQGSGMRVEPDPRAEGPLPSTKKRGTGLGIPFAYKVIHAHGGQLQFDHAPGGGTLVRLQLPLRNPK